MPHKLFKIYGETGLSRMLKKLVSSFRKTFAINVIGFFCAIGLAGCSGMEQSEYENLRKQNSVKEAITFAGDNNFSIAEPLARPRPKYPWERGGIANLPRITKEYFRCKGSFVNPDLIDPVSGDMFRDCEGGSKHSLPLIYGKEGVYPVLINLLNFIQLKTGNRVVITCGHRCPAHNAYADNSKRNRTSKHMIGAEVDFYVRGMEEQPMKVVELLFQYYRETAAYKGRREYTLFSRYEKDDTDVSIAPWFNKEIFIKLYQKDEGRDFDNRHPYPYIGIQVRYDRELDERVAYTWEKAHRNYLRY